MPVFGTCAGMILLATEVLDGRPDQRSFGAIDIAVRRNGYGRQVDSFEADLDVRRARRARSTPCSSGRRRSCASATDVEVLAEHDGVPVLLATDTCMRGIVPSRAHRRPRLHARCSFSRRR